MWMEERYRIYMKVSYKECIVLRIVAFVAIEAMDGSSGCQEDLSDSS